MDEKEFLDSIRKKVKKLKAYATDTAPRIVGQIAVNHIREDFSKGGFTNKGFHKWEATKRQQSGGAQASSKYGPLLSGRNRLMMSVKDEPGLGKVRIYTNVEYAAIHNEGGNTNPKVTAKMKKFAWAMYYKETGSRKKQKKKKRKKTTVVESEEARRWKALALTKKKQLHVNIPKRQFMPDSAGIEMADKINKRIDKDIQKIMEK